VQQSITTNTLFYGDNLAIMREYIPDESVDLVYLNPPFNTNRGYDPSIERATEFSTTSITA
jgi:site-specific DNA-methyltransferase (adenine-specific)